MSRILLERYSWARETKLRFAEVLEKNGFPSNTNIFKILEKAANITELEQWNKSLSDSYSAQLSICFSSLLWYYWLQRLGIHPNCVLGHSLGELMALFASGYIDETTLILISAYRGRAMSPNPDLPGAMAALSCSINRVYEIVEGLSSGGYWTVANINSPEQTVISGEVEVIDKIIILAEKHLITAKKLRVSNAFHSKMVSAASEYIRECESIPGERTPSLSSDEVALISARDGTIIRGPLSIKEYVGTGITSCVNFIESVKTISTMSDILVEVGPGRVLSDLARKVVGEDSPILCLCTESNPKRNDDINNTLAELFSLGLNFNMQMIFENRLLRPFVPPRLKSFIRNPCENEYGKYTPATLTGAFR